MTAREIIRGLDIIEKARPSDKSGYHVRADHDTIWAGDLEWPLTEDQRYELEETLGWSRDEDANGWRAMV